VKALREPAVAAAVLVTADVVLVAAHFAYRHDPLYHLGHDGSYSEMFQYAKAYALACTFAALWWRYRQAVFGAWMLLFVFVLCDDALRIHERYGEALATQLAYPSVLGLRAKDLGELTVWTAFGLGFAALLFATYRRSSAEARRASRVLGLLFAILVFFGVALDMAHEAVSGRFLRHALGVIEDGGEMLAMSLICWFAFALAANGGSARAFPPQSAGVTPP
jgi:hypothetical protein